MSIGRKPAHIVIQDGKSNRQRVWETIRKHPEGISCYTISRRTELNDETVKTYISSLRKAGYIERGAGLGDRTEYRLIRDVGSEAPKLKLDGSPSRHGLGTEAMWRTLRILDNLNASELALHASYSIPTTVATAKNYLKWLNWAGYLTIIFPSIPGRQARYSLKTGMYTGPLPPIIQRCGQLYDPNLNLIAFTRNTNQVLQTGIEKDASN